MTRSIAAAGIPLAFLALTMCGSGDSGNGSGSSSGGGSGSTSSGGGSGTSSGSSSGSSGSSSGSSGGGSSGSTSGGSGSGSGSSSGGSGSTSGGSSGSTSGSTSSGSGSGSSSGSGSGSSSGSGDDGGSSGDDGGGEAGPAGPFALSSTDFMMASGNGAVNVCFANGQTHGTGDNSPALAWSGAPAGTQSFAVSLHDTENNGVHWVMWNIPANVTSLPAMLPSGAMPGAPAPMGSMQRSASWVGGDQYAGPGAGPPVRAYQFQVWALSAPLTVASGDSTTTIFKKLQMTSTAHATLAACGDIMADCGACDLGQYATM